MTIFRYTLNKTCIGSDEVSPHTGQNACLVTCQPCSTLCDTMDYIACQAPPSMGFFRQGHWSGLPSPPPGDLSDPGIELLSLMSPVLARGFFTTSITWDALGQHGHHQKVYKQ